MGSRILVSSGGGAADYFMQVSGDTVKRHNDHMQD